MGTITKLVFLKGRLVGMGLDAICDLKAIKVTMPGSSESTFDQPKILNAPAVLPDGLYTLHWVLGTLALKKHNGDWLSAEV
jgi:hypothetical protein